VLKDGVFYAATKLFGITFKERSDLPTYNADVRTFEVFEEDGTPLALFIFDPFARASKRGGAWMNEVVGRSALFPQDSGAARLPVAYLVCNGSSPIDGKPSLMTFREIETLFHEFGHTLQHMLTRVDYGLAAGIRNVDWDAVELPSQFMENWCYQRETLKDISAHTETGEPLPDHLYEKIQAARTFRAGSDMLRQLYFAVTDLELHGARATTKSETAFDIQRRVAETTTVMPPLDGDRFLCSFGHIFAGGYAAGYYSYKWAEVLAADAFSAFEESGIFDEQTARRFRSEILEIGGSKDIMEAVIAFRGRRPTMDALLRYNGIGLAA